MPFFQSFAWLATGKASVLDGCWAASFFIQNVSVCHQAPLGILLTICWFNSKRGRLFPSIIPFDMEWLCWDKWNISRVCCIWIYICIYIQLSCASPSGPLSWCLFCVCIIGNRGDPSRQNCSCVLHLMSMADLAKVDWLFLLWNRQLFTVFIFIYGLTWDVLKTWAVFHGVLFHPRYCSDWAASDSAISGVVNICPCGYLPLLSSGSFSCVLWWVVAFFHRLDRVRSICL